MKKLLLTSLLALPLVANAFTYVPITPEEIKDVNQMVQLDVDRFTPRYGWTTQVVHDGAGYIDTKVVYDCGSMRYAEPIMRLHDYTGRILKTESYPKWVKPKKGSLDEFKLNKICEYREFYLD